MYRGIVFAAMTAAGSLLGGPNPSAVAPAFDGARETRIANLAGETMNNDVAKIAGRGAFQQQQPLSKQEALSILLLISQRPRLQNS